MEKPPFINWGRLSPLFVGKGKAWATAGIICAFFALSGSLTDLRHFEVRDAPSTDYKTYNIFRADGQIMRCEARDIYQKGWDCTSVGNFWNP